MSSRYREVVLTPYMSRAEAADYLGVTDRTIDRYIASGRLKAVRVGPRLLRIPLAAIDALITDEGASK